MADTKGSLFSKLAKILGEVGRVEKRGFNSFHQYPYALEADIADAVREKLAAQNVFMFYSVIDTRREVTDEAKGQALTTVVAEITFADGDSGETYTVRGVGTGEDKGDKGAAKAMTMAAKYALLKNFLIPTGDDPEADEATDKRHAAKPKEQRTPDGTAAPERPAPAPAPQPRRDPPQEQRPAPAPAPVAPQQSAPANGNGGRKPVTPAQLLLIQRTADEIGLDEQGATQLALRYGKVMAVGQMASMDASRLITDLLAVSKHEKTVESLFGAEPAPVA